jgi:hypothetical protein
MFLNLRRFLMIALVCASAIGLAAPAQARIFVGIGIPFAPLWIPPPVYYPPPAYYPPPPVYYAPPPQTYAPPPQTYAPQDYSQAGAGQMCHAQAYSCPMDRPAAPGSSCYCLGNGGQRVWGQSN